MSEHEKVENIFGPSTSLNWQELPPLPVKMIHAQSVWLDGTLYIGGFSIAGFTYTTESLRDTARLYTFQPCVDTEWSHIDTPTSHFGLVAYKSQLLLVGGKEHPSGKLTSKIFTLRDGELVETLPPMREKRYSSSAVSIGSVLIVAGGRSDSDSLSSVEFLEDGQWKTAPSLPRGGYEMSSALDGDQWYLIYDKTVYSVLLSSLTSGSDESPWTTLPDAPNDSSAASFLGGHLLSIGGHWYNPTTAINAFSTASQSWEHVADLPIPLYCSSAIVLPTGELVIAGGVARSYNYSDRVFIKCTPVDPNTPFYTAKLFNLHHHGVNLIEALSKNRFRFYATSGVMLVMKEREKAPSLSARDYVELVFKAWERSKRPTYPATWEGLFTVLRKMDLGHLVQPIAKIATGTVPELEQGSKSPEPLPQEVVDPGNTSDEQDVETPEEAIDRLNKVNAEYVNTIIHLRLENRALLKETSILQEETSKLQEENCKLRSWDTKPVVKQEPLYPTTEFDYQSTSSALKQEQEFDKKPLLSGESSSVENVELLLQTLHEYKKEIKQLRAQLDALEMERSVKTIGVSTGVSEQETGTVVRESDQSPSPAQSHSPGAIHGDLLMYWVPAVSGAGRSVGLTAMTSHYPPQPSLHYHVHLPGTSSSGFGFPSMGVLSGSVPGPFRAMSIDELVGHVGISRELLDREVSNQHLRQIAALLPNWQSYAKPLGLTSLQILDLHDKTWADNTAKALELLEKWHQKQAFNAQYSHLVELCLSLGHGTAAEEICKLLHSRKSEGSKSSESVMDTSHPEPSNVCRPPLSKRLKVQSSTEARESIAVDITDSVHEKSPNIDSSPGHSSVIVISSDSEDCGSPIGSGPTYSSYQLRHAPQLPMGQPHLPPGSLPPGSLPPGSLPPGSLPPGSLPPGSLPPGSLPPGSLPLRSLPPGYLPPGSLPPGYLPPGYLPPGYLPPGSLPLGSLPPELLRLFGKSESGVKRAPPEQGVSAKRHKSD